MVTRTCVDDYAKYQSFHGLMEGDFGQRTSQCRYTGKNAERGSLAAVCEGMNAEGVMGA